MGLCDSCRKVGNTTSVIEGMLTKSQVRRALKNHNHPYWECFPNDCLFYISEELGL